MPSSEISITCVVGARPNFMKMAALFAAAPGFPALRLRLVHTGQHYDERMSALFFRDLQMPQPDAFLGVGGGSHAVQTASVMTAFDRDLDQHPADGVLVVGDVNSTLACALVAAKRIIPVAHVEAGLRSGDRRMPEEINRVLTDQVSTYLFTTERTAAGHLTAEGVSADRVFFVGNVMVDTLLRHRGRARESGILSSLDLEPRGYAVCTLHRPSNVDDQPAAENTARAILSLAARLPTVLPMHPRTRARLEEFGLFSSFASLPALKIVEPLGYLEFIALLDQARLVFTDSGGVQEETTVLGVPCLTFRDNTERPVTITEGTNRLIGTDAAGVPAELDAILNGETASGRIPELWDGRAAERILAILDQRMRSGSNGR